MRILQKIRLWIINALGHTELDALTGLYGRGYLDLALDREVALSKRHGTPLSLVLLDIDHFKSVNDTLGHLAGDDVLRTVARVLKMSLRNSDLVARYGGEEFLLILSSTGLNNAVFTADRIRQRLEAAEASTIKGKVRVTASFGVAELEADMGVADLVDAADRALYHAKRSGRNRVAYAEKGQLFLN